MRADLSTRLAPFRIRHWQFMSPDSFGGCGMFQIPLGAVTLAVMASDGSGWLGHLPPPAFEHVSVSIPGIKRCPYWEEMDRVKQLFWDDDETVIQLHVPRSKHVSFHDYCLHLWKPIGVEIPLPPTSTVGPQS